MARKGTFEQKLAQLRRAEQDPFSAKSIAAFRKALLGANKALAAAAAAIVAQYAVTDLIPDLVASFDRFLGRQDKGCLAKTALVEALDRLEHYEPELFLRGLHHVQMEPVYGGRVDTAANLRANCALALARFGYPDVLFELATLVMDPQVEARRGAVKALTHLARDESELLLRVKALAGDAEPDVTGECLHGLIQIAPERSLPFVARFLGGPDLFVAEAAAIALGESRLPEAFGVLHSHWEDSIDPAFKEMLALPIALTRCDEALAFLLDVVETAHRDTAAAAVRALKVFDDDACRPRIRAAADTRDEPAVRRAYAEAFQADTGS